MKFYNETQPLYLETDVSGVGLRAALLQTSNNKTAQKTKHQTTVSSDPLPLQARACQAQKKDTVLLKERH